MTDIGVSPIPGDDSSNEINMVVKICDQVDGVVCYAILTLVTVYALWIYAREIFYIRKSHTLRTFILFLTFADSLCLVVYTCLARKYHGSWDDAYEYVGDLVTTTISFVQYYLVVVWFKRASLAIDDGFERAPVFEVSLSNFVALAITLAYNAVGYYLLGTGRLGLFRTFQDYITFSVCILFLFVGSYYIFLVQRYTNVLDISSESYSVIRRSRLTAYLLACCCIFAAVLPAVAIFTDVAVSNYVNVMETKFYSCHRIPCLINFLVRVIFLVAAPNIAVSFTFSTPYEPYLFLLPLNRASKIKYTAISDID